MKKLINTLFAIAALGFLSTASAQDYVEGIHYAKITPAQPTTTKDQIEVAEMFWYGCPHCYNFEPHINKWKESIPSHVKFIRIPATFRPEWAVHARAYYTAETLGVLDKFHPAFFDAMQKQRRQMLDENELAAFFEKETGVEPTKFKKTFRSFSVKAKLQRAILMTNNSGITGVPSLIINGKYRTSATNAGSFEDMLDVTNMLVEKEKAELKK